MGAAVAGGVPGDAAALLLPDPCDEHCPEDFKEKARALLPQVQDKPGLKDEDLQQALFKFIGDFANWDLAANQTYLDVSRGLVKAAHPEETPLVGSGPVRGRRFDTARSIASRLRRLCERPQPCGLLDRESHAGGHPAPRVRVGLRASARGSRDQDNCRERTCRILPTRSRRHTTHRLPLGAHGALRVAELQRERSFALSGCARRRIASGRCAAESSPPLPACGERGGSGTNRRVRNIRAEERYRRSARWR